LQLIRTFQLQNVTIDTEFGVTEPLKDLDITISASLSAGGSSASFNGTYSNSKSWSITADIQSFSFDSLSDLFTHISGDKLTLPEKITISIGSAHLAISKNVAEATSKFDVLVKDVSIGTYAAKTAPVQITPSGIVISSGIGDVPFKSVTLKGAQLNASFMASKAAKTSTVSLSGGVSFQRCPTLVISAAVHLYTGDKDTLEYTIYGSVAHESKVTLGDIVKLQGTDFGDLALGNLLFVVASQDDPEVSELNPQKHKIKEGLSIQFIGMACVAYKTSYRRPDFCGAGRIPRVEPSPSNQSRWPSPSTTDAQCSLDETC
jgi:hypothetical protein